MNTKRLATTLGMVMGFTVATGLAAALNNFESPYTCTEDLNICLKDSDFDGTPDTIETRSINRTYDNKGNIQVENVSGNYIKFGFNNFVPNGYVSVRRTEWVRDPVVNDLRLASKGGFDL